MNWNTLTLFRMNHPNILVYPSRDFRATGVCSKCGSAYVLVVNTSDDSYAWFPVGEPGCQGGRFCDIKKDQPSRVTDDDTKWQIVHDQRSCPNCGAKPLVEIPDTYDPRDTICEACRNIVYDGS